ncbi:tRNA pseudouridine(55) synthase TruB [Balneolaceae bacterium ANBcel3]|nr:tRNA pseudouridine(55) synthase TruB [Balneolaceae bacterium ANBcel3]
MGAEKKPLSSYSVFDTNHVPDETTDFAAGALFLVDKPSGWSSFDIVKFIRNRIRTKKTGHAGTLDPLATGLLILCCGKATKSISLIQDYPKRYIAEATLGASTPSQDAATKPDETSDYEHVDEKGIEAAIKAHFTGEILQIPPMYSALWKDGKRLYTYARKGETVERAPRTVSVHSCTLTSFERPAFKLDILCSKGTYVRTLIHDLGTSVGSLAYMSALRRTEIGPYGVDTAITIEQIRNGYFDNL